MRSTLGTTASSPSTSSTIHWLPEVALRSGNAGMVCLLDGGLHQRFRSGRFAYLGGHKLHPAQFTELVAQIFYDQTVLDPEACRVTYYSNRPLKAIVAQTSGRRSYDPYLQELHDPSRLARMLGYYTSQEPNSLLFRGRAHVHLVAAAGWCVHAVRRYAGRDRGGAARPRRAPKLGRHSRYEGVLPRKRQRWTSPKPSRRTLEADHPPCNPSSASRRESVQLRRP